MKTRDVLPFILIFGLLAACDDPPEQSGPPTFGLDGSAELPDASTATDGALAENDAAAPRVGPAFGVVSSDYTATSISLLDEQGNVVADNYLNSGSARAGLVTALSGDVTLPSLSGENGVLVVLDRYRTDVITRVRLSDGAILGQVKTHTPPTQTTENAYSSNPHDYVFFEPTSAWISRHEPNLDPGVAEIDRGTDLLRIDPGTMQRTSDRIDLSVLNTTGTRTNTMTMQPEQVDVYARPSRLTRLGNTLVVGLSRLSFDFSTYGTGAIAIVDVQTRAVTGFELSGLANCSEVGPVRGASDQVLVGCSGFRGQGSDPRTTGGIALVRIANGAGQLLHIWRAAEHPNDPTATNNVFSLGGTLVGAVSFGAREAAAMGSMPATPARPDQLLVLDLATGVVLRELFRAEAPYSLGGGLFDPDTGLVLVPDASVDANKRPTAGVRRFRFTAPSTFEELPLVKVAESLNMPVRTIDFL